MLLMVNFVSVFTKQVSLNLLTRRLIVFLLHILYQVLLQLLQNSYQIDIQFEELSSSGLSSLDSHTSIYRFLI